MKYKFNSFKVYYVNDKYETKLYGEYDDYQSAIETCVALVENAIYIYGIINQDSKVMVYKEETKFISDMDYITNNYVEF